MNFVKVTLFKIRCVDIKPFGTANRDTVGYSLYPVRTTGRCVDDGGQVYELPPGCSLQSDAYSQIKIVANDNVTCDVDVSSGGFPQIVGGQFHGFILPLLKGKS